MCSEKVTLKKIEDLRHQLALKVQTKGYTNNETVAVSQELDGLLNLYNKILEKKSENAFE